MANFSIVSSNSTFGAPPAGSQDIVLGSIAVGNGNILIAVVSTTELSHTDHIVSGGSGTWTKIYGIDGTSALPQRQSVWWRPVEAGDGSSVTITGTVTGATVSFRVSAVQIAPSTNYNAELADFAVAEGGVGVGTNLSSGNTSNITESDLLVVGVGSLSVGLPNPTTIAFTPAKQNNFVEIPTGSLGQGHIVGFDTAGEAAGVKSVTLTADGATVIGPHGGACGVVVFQSTVTEITGTGAITTGATQVSGTGAVTDLSTGTGASVTPAADISGTGTRQSTGTGAIIAPAADVSGTAQRESTGTGAINVPAADVSGAGNVGALITGTGAINATAADVSGTGNIVDLITGTGAIEIGPVEIGGTGQRVITGTGNIQVGEIVVSGFGEPNLGRLPRGAGKQKRQPEPQLPEAKTQGRVTGPQRMRELARQQMEREEQLERLRYEESLKQQRIVDDAVAMLLLS